jgi:hypothetical protein
MLLNKPVAEAEAEAEEVEVEVEANPAAFKAEVEAAVVMKRRLNIFFIFCYLRIYLLCQVSLFLSFSKQLTISLGKIDRTVGNV